MQTATFGKLDAPLARLLAEQQFEDTEAFPITIRCASDSMSRVIALVEGLGGKERHRLARLSAVSVWLPLAAVEAVARDSRVTSMELELGFMMAEPAHA